MNNLCKFVAISNINPNSMIKMKTVSKHFVKILACVAFALTLYSCGGGERSVSSRIDNVVPDNADLIYAGNIQRAFDQLDIKVSGGKLVLPQYMWDIIDVAGRNMSDQVEDRLEEFKGIDYNSIVVAARKKGDDVNVIVNFGVSDVDALYDFVSEYSPMIDLDRTEGYQTLGTSDGEILIKDGEAYVVIQDGEALSGKHAVRAVERWMSDASEKPLATWKRDYLTRQSVSALWVSSNFLQAVLPSYTWKEMSKTFDNIPGVSLKNLSLGHSADLDGDKATANITVFNGDKVMKTPVGGTFDTDLLKYACKRDMLAFGCAANTLAFNLIRSSLNDEFDSSINYYRQELDEANERAQYMDEDDYYSYYYTPQYIEENLRIYTSLREAINNLMDCLSGSAIITMGPTTDDMELFVNNPQENLHVCIAGACKPNKAKQAVDAAFDILQNSFDKEYFWKLPDGFKLSVEDETVYFQADGNNIVINYGEREGAGDGKFDKSVFADSWVAGQYLMPEKTELMNGIELPFGVSAWGKGNEMSFDFEMKLNGAKGNFVPAIVNAALEVMHNF